jgi:hypothetical protein
MTYCEARKTHVWLGEEREHLPIVSLFRELASRNFIPGNIDKALLHKCVAEFVKSPWFARRWILQESALSLDVIFRHGGEKITRNALVRAVDIALHSESLDLGQIEVAAAGALMVLKLDRQDSQPILDLLDTFSLSECSDPRDRLFALFSLAEEKDLGASVEYFLPWWHVYTSFAQMIVHSGKTSQLLDQVVRRGMLAHLNPAWPSWVPNWRAHPASKEKAYHMMQYAGAKTVMYDQDQCALAISEAKLAPIQNVFESPPDELSSLPQLRNYVMCQLDKCVVMILGKTPKRENQFLCLDELYDLKYAFTTALLSRCGGISWWHGHRHHISDHLYPMCFDFNLNFSIPDIINGHHHAVGKVPREIQCADCRRAIPEGLFTSICAVLRTETFFLGETDMRWGSLDITPIWASATKVTLDNQMLLFSEVFPHLYIPPTVLTSAIVLTSLKPVGTQGEQVFRVLGSCATTSRRHRYSRAEIIIV